jgi:hypothetical protein
MSGSRTTWLWLLFIGIVLAILTVYGSFHPSSWVTTPAMLVFLGYLIIIPFLLWFIKGQLILRVVVGSMWVIYVTMWLLALYEASTT